MIALYYRARAAWPEAEPLFERALAIGETLGPESADLASYLNNFAPLYRDTGRYAEAEPLFERALAISETLGPESADLAFFLNNLAGLFQGTGRYAEAEPLLKRAFTALKKNLPPDHPYVAMVCKNYSDLLDKLGRTNEAFEFRTHV